MTSRHLGSALALLLLLPLTGCGDRTGSTPSADGTHDAKREWRLAGDEDATADEIIDAGRPARVAASGDQTLITWLVNPEDDEGPAQGAWRLYAADGRRVADGKLGIVHEASAHAEVVGVEDGFLIENYTSPELLHLSPAGELTTVTVKDEARPTRAGDVLVRECCEALVYRPSDHAAYALPPMPSDQWQSVRVDADGTVWVMLPWARNGDARIASAPGGVAPWTTEEVDLPDGSAPTIDMALAEGELMFPQIGASVTEFNEYQAIWRRSVDAGNTRWRSVPLDSSLMPRTTSVSLAKTADHRVLISGDSEDTLLERADGTFATLELPGEGARVTPVGSRLYANFWQKAELYVSEDFGETWAVVPR